MSWGKCRNCKATKPGVRDGLCRLCRELAPHITAAERERIRQLAIKHCANAKVHADNEAGYRWILFADLLAEEASDD